MDAIVLAVITSAVTILASECIKGVGSEAGKEVWSQIKVWFGWEADPPIADLSAAVAKKLLADPALVAQVMECLQKENMRATHAGVLVGKINATNSVVADTISVSGDWKM